MNLNKNEKVLISERVFLNEYDNLTDLESISSDIVLDKPFGLAEDKINEDIYDSYTAFLNISDGNKTATIEATVYDVDDEAEVKNVLNKLDILINTITTHKANVLVALRTAKEGKEMLKKIKAETKAAEENK